MDTVVQFLFLDDNKVFLVPALIVVALVIIEVLMMIVGLSLGELFHAFDFDKPDFEKGGSLGFVDWINAGHVPTSVFLAALLMTFSLFGYIAQWILFKTTGGVWTPLLVGPVVLIPTIFAVRHLTRGLAYLVRREHTTATYLDSLEGQVGPVTIPASLLHAGQAKVRDAHGQIHYVRILPEGEDDLKQGDDVVLLESENHVFKARKI